MQDVTQRSATKRGQKNATAIRKPAQAILSLSALWTFQTLMEMDHNNQTELLRRSATSTADRDLLCWREHDGDDINNIKMLDYLTFIRRLSIVAQHNTRIYPSAISHMHELEFGREAMLVLGSRLAEATHRVAPTFPSHIQTQRATCRYEAFALKLCCTILIGSMVSWSIHVTPLRKILIRCPSKVLRKLISRSATALPIVPEVCSSHSYFLIQELHPYIFSLSLPM